MIELAGLVAAGGVFYAWVRGAQWARWAVFLGLCLVGGMLAAGGLKEGQSLELRYLIVAGVSFFLSGTPTWLRGRRLEPITIDVGRPFSTTPQRVLTHGAGDGAPHH